MSSRRHSCRQPTSVATPPLGALCRDLPDIRRACHRPVVAPPIPPRRRLDILVTAHQAQLEAMQRTRAQQQPPHDRGPGRALSTRARSRLRIWSLPELPSVPYLPPDVGPLPTVNPANLCRPKASLVPARCSTEFPWGCVALA